MRKDDIHKEDGAKVRVITNKELPRSDAGDWEIREKRKNEF